MDRKDAGFRKKLLETFKIEAQEHAAALASGLLELEKAASEKEVAAFLERIFRGAHSLKGAARSVNESGIESLCQAMEDVFAALQKKRISLSQASFDVLHEAVSLVGRFSQVPASGTGPDQEPVTGLLQNLADIAAGLGIPSGRRAARPGGETIPGAPPQPTAPAEAGKIPEETVRISTAKLDSLLYQAEELFPVKLAVDQLTLELGHLQRLAANWKKTWAKVQNDIRTLEKELTPGVKDRQEGNPPTPIGRVLKFLEWNRTLLDSMDSGLKAVHGSSEQSRQALRGAADGMLLEVKKALMLPFNPVLEVFPKMVRDFSREQGKEISLVMKGGDIEIDKRILLELKDVLIHVVRNCVDHGVERPEERVRKSKPAGGTISLVISQKEGNLVEIAVADDGAGMDAGTLKAESVKQGAISEAGAAALSANDILELAFRSGISTSSTITTLSGRGLGLAIVREKLEGLEGTVSVESSPGKGTTIRMTVPVTLATFRSVVVRLGDRRFAVPLSGIWKAARSAPKNVKTLGSKEAVVLDGQAVSLVRLADILGLPSQDGRGSAATSFSMVVLGNGDKRVAFRVDEVLGEQELMMKSLGSQLQRVRNISGAAILASGRVIPVLNVPDLLRSAIQGAGVQAPSIDRPEKITETEKTVLVVEDSITSRTLIKNILESAGYRVETAVDGLDGLSKLAAGGFHAVVSDVDMPRMNGFELTTRIRADNRFSSLPVVLITSLESRRDHERGFAVGAQAYIVKTRFDQGNLLDILRRLL